MYNSMKDTDMFRLDRYDFSPSGGCKLSKPTPRQRRYGDKMADKITADKVALEDNPFVYNAPVQGTDFYNREKIAETLLRETVTGKKSQGNVWITGERQVGKTSLLRFMQSKYENSLDKVKLYKVDGFFKVSFIDLNVQDTKTTADFYRNLRQSLKTASTSK